MQIFLMFKQDFMGNAIKHYMQISQRDLLFKIQYMSYKENYTGKAVRDFNVRFKP